MNVETLRVMRLAVRAVGAALLLVIIGSAVLLLAGEEVPEAFVALGSAALGSLGTLLTTLRGRNGDA